MKVKIVTKLNENIDNLDVISPLNINEKVVYFLEHGFKPDDLGYLCKNGKYIKILDEGIHIVKKSEIWKNGFAINDNMYLLHIDD